MQTLRRNGLGKFCSRLNPGAVTTWLARRPAFIVLEKMTNRVKIKVAKEGEAMLAEEFG